MKLHPEGLFHIYNRGNNSQIIFFKEENYIYFLRKIRNHIPASVDILSYCLMPNHFHFLMATSDRFDLEGFRNSWKIILISYTKGINKQKNRTGSLFQQHTKSKQIDTNEYALACFTYIHQNPLSSGLVKTIAEWDFSSYPDYAGLRKGTLCNKELARKLLDLPKPRSDFFSFSQRILPDGYHDNIFE